MKNNYTRFILSISLIIALVAVSTISAFAVSNQPEGSLESQSGNTSFQVLSMAIEWLHENYYEFYDLRNVDARIVRVFENDNVTRYTVALSCETMLKFKSVDELPFVKGLNATLAGSSLKSSSEERLAISSYVNEIDASIGEYRGLTVDVVIEIDKNDIDTPWAMYYQDGMETTLYEINALTLDADEMYDAGYRSASEILSAYTASDGRGYSSYNRINARDYALRWVGSPSSCSDCGTSCGILQNRSLWNNSVYPYHTLFKHSDCADFVSQAMSAGGLPESGTWFRTKYVTTQSWGAAWTSVASQKAWMTDSSRKYWDASTHAVANAGNIILTSSSHVVMITLNDTVTFRFTGHTNDRKDYGYSNNSAYQYFTIKTT